MFVARPHLFSEELFNVIVRKVYFSIPILLIIFDFYFLFLFYKNSIFLYSRIDIQATLWAEQAELFEDKYRALKSNNIVLIMTSVLIKTYQGVICLSASSGTKFYLNYDFDSVTDFQKRYYLKGPVQVRITHLNNF